MSIERKLLKNKAYSNGRWISSDQSIPVYNPATDELVSTVPILSAQQVNEAIVAADKAQKGWAGLTAQARADYLMAWRRLIDLHTDELAEILTLEQGKPLVEARAEILAGAAFLDWFSEEAKRVYGDIIPTIRKDLQLQVTKEPIGTVAAITPWNFPFSMIMRKAAPALAAGCTMVLKPAEATPLTALALAALAELAGIPAGVFNVVTGKASIIGGELTSNSLVRKLSFTGSTRIGKLLMEQCASTVKKLSLELGGNAPLIVFDDADIDAAVAGAMASKYRNSGQTCICINRMIIQNGIYDTFITKLREAVSQLRVGNGMEDGINFGPLIDSQSAERVARVVERAVEQGAKLIIGGQQGSEGSAFYPPTILTDIEPDMDICHQEIFGPVSTILHFSTEEQAIAMANDSDLGLASYLYTKDIGRIIRISRALEYGMVGVNETGISNHVAPFGGVKESGLGREGSKYGMDEYLEIKYVCIGGL